MPGARGAQMARTVARVEHPTRDIPFRIPLDATVTEAHVSAAVGKFIALGPGEREGTLVGRVTAATRVGSEAHCTAVMHDTATFFAGQLTGSITAQGASFQVTDVNVAALPPVPFV